MNCFDLSTQTQAQLNERLSTLNSQVEVTVSDQEDSDRGCSAVCTGGCNGPCESN